MVVQNRVVEVSTGNDVWYRRVLLFEKHGRFLCWDGSETLDQAENCTHVHTWDYMREIPEPKYVPFEWKDGEELRGKQVRSKWSKNIEETIKTLYLDENGVFKITFEKSRRYITAQKLLDSYEFIDGSPCGKLVQEL